MFPSASECNMAYTAMLPDTDTERQGVTTCSGVSNKRRADAWMTMMLKVHVAGAQARAASVAAQKIGPSKAPLQSNTNISLRYMWDAGRRRTAVGLQGVRELLPRCIGSVYPTAS